MSTSKPRSIAQVVLKHAVRVIAERGACYGTPTEGLLTAAKLWSVILGSRISAWQVALCLDALKTARILATPGHLDSWLDKCGYSALGAEVAPIPSGDFSFAEHRKERKEQPCSL